VTLQKISFKKNLLKKRKHPKKILSTQYLKF